MSRVLCLILCVLGPSVYGTNDGEKLKGVPKFPTTLLVMRQGKISRNQRSVWAEESTHESSFGSSSVHKMVTNCADQGTEIAGIVFQGNSQKQNLYF